MRIFVLFFKITPYVDLFPGKLKRIFIYKSFQLESIVIVIYLLVGFIYDFAELSRNIVYFLGMFAAVVTCLCVIAMKNPLALLAILHGIIITIQIARLLRLDFLIFIWVSVIGTATLRVTKIYFLFNCSNFYLFQKISLGIFITLQILFSLLYIDTMLENDTEHSTKLCVYGFLYTLFVTTCFNEDRELHVIPRIIVYEIGAAVLPL
ncbi:hypothetical protein GN956_G25553, partial [Arapaima gigas]